MKIIGYRSKTKWKMWIASTVYGIAALFVVVMVIALSTPASKPASDDEKSPEWQASFKQIAVQEAETYIELTEKNGSLPADRLKEHAGVVKQQADKMTTGKEDFLKLGDLIQQNKIDDVKALVDKLKKS